MDRKSKLAYASKARRHRLLTCYLASTLGLTAPFATNCVDSLAFDIPPTATSNSKTQPQMVDQTGSNAQALKRVGIRFVDPNANAKGTPTAGPHGMNSETTQLPFKLVQAPIATPGSAQSSIGTPGLEPQSTGVRIRIPSETSVAASPQKQVISSNSRPPESLKMTIGNATSGPSIATAPNKSVPVGTGFSAPPNVVSTVSTPGDSWNSKPSTPAVAMKPIPSTIAPSANTPPTFLPPNVSQPTFSVPTLAQPTLPQPTLVQQTPAQPMQKQATTGQPTPTQSKIASLPVQSLPTVMAETRNTPSQNDASSTKPESTSVATSKTQVRINDSAGVAPGVTSPVALPEPVPADSFAAAPKSNFSPAESTNVANNWDASSHSRAPGIVKIPGMTVSSQTASTSIGGPQSKTLSTTISGPPKTSSSVESSTPAFVNSESSHSLSTLPGPQTEPLKMRIGMPESKSNLSPGFSKLPNPAELAGSSIGPVTTPSSVPAAKIPRAELGRNEETVLASIPSSAVAQVPAPRYAESVTRQPTRFEPSVVPVALTSNMKKPASSTETESLELGDSTETRSRSNSDSNVNPSAKSGKGFAKLGIHENLARAQVNSGTVNVVLKNVQVVKLVGEIRHIKVENEDICQAIVTEANCITVIGASIGESKLAIWTKENNSAETEAQVFLISVKETWGEGAKNAVSIEEANRSISTLFPDSAVQIKSSNDGTLIVQGKATSNDSAKQIIMLVRKMFLVPVQDRIAVAAL